MIYFLKMCVRITKLPGYILIPNRITPTTRCIPTVPIIVKSLFAMLPTFFGH